MDPAPLLTMQTIITKKNVAKPKAGFTGVDSALKAERDGDFLKFANTR